MATEVTKLITVSIGKIQQSRQARNGLNLRRSLLVASVLHKARDIYVAEIKSRKTEQSEEPQPTKKRKFVSQSSIVDDTSDNDAECNTTTSASDTDCSFDTQGEQRMSETEAAVASLTDDVLSHISTDADTETDYTTENDKENDPPHTSVIVDSCKLCLKRKLVQDEHTETRNTAVQDIDKPSLMTYKRQRTDSLDTSDSKSESTQINNLVQIFSSSFPEFTDHKEDTTNSSCSNQSTELNTFSLCRESIALTA